MRQANWRRTKNSSLVRASIERRKRGRTLAPLLAVILALILLPDRGRADPLPGARGPHPQSDQAAPAQATSHPPLHPFDGEIRQLIEDVGSHCLLVDQEAVTPAQADLTTAIRTVRQSALGNWLVDQASRQQVMLCLDHRTTLEAHYRSHLKLLGLNARLDPAGHVVFLAHELAHIPQHPRFSNNRRFSPEDMVLLQRVREAAAEAVATRVLWQLKQRGVDAPWRKKLNTAYRDIAEGFEAAMGDDRSETREVWASRSAFYRWFDAAWRLEIYDDLMLKTLERIAVDRIGLIPTSRSLSEPYLRSVGSYAGQSFLVEGDGNFLINSFRTQGLIAESRARLDAILAMAAAETTGTLGPIADSALSPRPRHAAQR